MGKKNMEASRVSVNHGSHFQVRSGLCGKCGTVNYHPLLEIYKVLKLLEGGNAIRVRQSSMLGF